MSLDRAFDLGMASDILARNNRRSAAAQDDLAEAGLMLEARVRQLELALANAQVENAVLQMGVAGLGAQIHMLKSELKKAQPNNKLFDLAGGTYRDGSKRTILNSVYDTYFDKAGQAFASKLPHPVKSYRDEAK